MGEGGVGWGELGEGGLGEGGALGLKLGDLGGKGSEIMGQRGQERQSMYA
jgi:hypothetical protein